LAYLSGLLAAQGLRAKREFGQNFLIDLNLLDLLVRSAPVTGKDVVLEVGAGTGGLTTRLTEVAGYVVSVEIDPGFYQLACAEVESASNVTIVSTDILKGKNQLEPAVMDLIRAKMADLGRDHYHLVANLPYDVASSVIGNAILHELPIRSLTFTVQYEVGLRILAEPGTRDYGPLAVLTRTVGQATLIRVLPPAAFWPRPKVDSAFVRIDVDPDHHAKIPDLGAFHHFVRQLFIHRRKNLRGGIASIPDFKPLKKEIVSVLEACGLDREDRAESLSPATIYELYHCLNERGRGDR
jgi:16S rRNA (adenine1518-N6/adenine1519-N6)-dimethyltransferase